ncbi:Flp pilus assembly protein CpaB [Alloacidobacterium dinghuense]|uniref:Flp pilus assembly protein CpaB n=1 Tax=Alloacidobacterium dinghuense TaxID=2763107 RepID=A0A7G8BK15_9BACT|nr:Flp pilus assembly protein CpaB [Alloacidobacterium dinghuense]QNI32885.1 Flp pilus assembly protein CpaB [Alloacidobacterium dinghuense]
MNRRLLTILLIAFAIALGCSYVVYRMVGNRIMAAAAQPRATNVLVAANDVKLGSILKSSDLTTTQIVGALPKGAVVKPENAVGRGVLSDIYQGEPILESRLAAPGSGGGLAATIRSGMRACAVKVDEVVGVAGFVTPGMRVDVLISGNPPGTTNVNEGPKVKTLLQNIEVLSAGTDIQKDNEGKPQQVQVVNLLVSPEQAELLSLASNETKIQLVLRNPLDTEVTHPPGSEMTSLFTDIKPVPKVRSAAVHRASGVYTIEVLNGGKRTEEKFVSGEERQ